MRRQIGEALSDLQEAERIALELTRKATHRSQHQAAELRFSGGAGDENRTRTISLGS
jgi:hypothetical protein